MQEPEFTERERQRGGCYELLTQEQTVSKGASSIRSLLLAVLQLTPNWQTSNTLN